MQLKDSIATAVALMSTMASASINLCPPNGKGVCYSVGVPRSSASSGSGTIYMQIKAPASFSWVALGTGSGMASSNIFLVYQDGRGNITVSPRRGTRYTQPQLDTSSTAARLQLLAGSGVSSDGSMTANIACSNCQSWNGGSMGLADTQTSWIGAWAEGSSLATTNQNAGIRRHDDTSVFALDLSKAAIPSDSNPFLTGGSGSGNDNTGGSSGGSSGGVSFGSTGPSSLVLAHGAIMAILFVILYPLASMVMPLFGKWKVHGGAQVFNFILMWVGFALGITVAKDRSMLFNNAHTTLGVIVVCLLILQPFLGYAHHMHYVKHQRRGLVSYVHIIWGQSLIVLGIVNGGLGLRLTGVPGNFIIAYVVVAAVIFVLYAAVKVFTMFRAKRRSQSGDKIGPSPPTSADRRRPYP
ncbi:hypothetical protein, variant [Gaeumannomyces tritici R3-111a-1]|uniref:DOMON domain-containing protein n=1 Tax=Gaeumannomyces tritici (strain R3-111a-1) TaxID=644352 RepID=J3P9N2_GAET3|nr:hypothetical protein GGTG_10210 [Gaeumannomyces tritici R3-111a-1]XP_009226343.1 hypothetical protein, variant [Gaeumannomyces tritici R3-111a-1]EJT73368.1 hypothetical protein, variant [Gaeumannomyces tritici R3-111a-1]EJT73369.1 hypothetical protein GGTG_10210 [Gaeumannomyces tritici R3-111a-1]